jgi:hypothetical protein
MSTCIITISGCSGATDNATTFSRVICRIRKNIV